MLLILFGVGPPLVAIAIWSMGRDSPQTGNQLGHPAMRLSEISLEDLKREITLDSYVDELIEELSEFNPPASIADVRQRLEAFVQKVKRHAKPGDTLWEWVQGTVPFMQMGGVAVVREGKIVWTTMTWIS